MTLHGALSVVLAVSIVCPLAGPSFAQSLQFPYAPTAAAAAAQFDERARAVIEMNACGREDDYLRIRTEMAAGNFDSQGEGLTHILVAKLAYIRSQSPTHNSIPCDGKMFRPRTNKPDGKPFDSYEDFETADSLLRAAGPTACAKETGGEKQELQTEQGTVEGTLISLRVDPECMSRQVNEAILAMRKTTQMGSEGLPCHYPELSMGKGDFDVTVRELIRILYLSGQKIGWREGGILAPSTIDYMYTNLLAARGALSDDSYSARSGCDEPAGDDLGSPEDTADRHDWYRELGDELGDVFGWLWHLFIDGMSPAQLVLVPFVLAAGGDFPAGVVLPADVFLPRIPETENHRLMIETSRYLTNADMIARLEAEGYDHVDELRFEQFGVRVWLYMRLQDIAAHDFQEYNSRPYTRYSLNAVLNLHDFAAVTGDTKLATAAHIVLDLSEAKFAATSNRGRRIVPFRRLSDGDGDEGWYLYESFSGADHEVTRAMLLSGQTQLLDGFRVTPPPDPADPITKRNRVIHAALAEMVNAATSEYRLPPPVLATAVERRTFEQTVQHAGVERVLQSPAFTISAGGVRTGPTTPVFGYGRPKDRGVAMPTVIIPTVAGAYMKDLFRFDGIGSHHDRTANTCVAPGFACGIQPKLSEAFLVCTKRHLGATGGNFFVSSAECLPADPGPHFYLAARIDDCPDAFCQWGVMEIVEATPPPPNKDGKREPDPAFTQFQVDREAALNTLTLDEKGNGTYVTATGHRIDFNLVNEGQPSIVAIDGVPPPDWVTAGDAIDGVDGQGRATLEGPGGPIHLDFSDWSNPTRTP